jgi:hypothetical protein
MLAAILSSVLELLTEEEEEEYDCEVTAVDAWKEVRPTPM